MKLPHNLTASLQSPNLLSTQTHKFKINNGGGEQGNQLKDKVHKTESGKRNGHMEKQEMEMETEMEN